MAEVLPPHTTQGHLVHSTDANIAPQAGSLWTNSSWFSTPPAPCPNDRPRHELPTPTPHRSSLEMKSVGGAVAQSRFSGRCAVPIATVAPVDGSPVPVTVAPPPRGATCDGSKATKTSSTARSGGGLMSAWRFDMQRWAWVPRDGGGVPNMRVAKHQLAARRWGDGRDELPAAARQTQQHAERGTSVATSQLTAAGTKTSVVSTARTDSSAGFASIGGLWKQKTALRDAVVLPLRHPRLFTALGTQGLRGVLCHGPPGTGKTFVMPALAAEARAHLEVVDGAAVAAGTQAAQQLQRAFQRAKSHAPAVLFIDCLDALAPARQPGAAAEDQQQAQLLASLLDQLAASGAAVAVVAAAGQRSHVSPALLRPGRLGVEVPFGLPTAAERQEALEHITRCMPLSGVSVAELSDRTRGFVAADCAAVCAGAATACVAEAIAAAEAAAALQQVPLEVLEQRLLGAQLRVTRQHFAAALQATGPCSLRAVALPEVPNVAWEDIGGYEGVKQTLREMIEVPLARPALLTAFGATPSSGALLYGPPGCGKTLLAQAAAAQCGANFIAVRGPELLDKWLGESERAVRSLFATARAAAPCIIFFDEMDSLAAKPDVMGGGGGDGAAGRVLAQLLAEMDGVASRGQRVFVLGATNRPGAMDPAVLRPGRLDALIEVPLPDEAARLAILRARLRAVPLATGVDAARLAALTPGLSGADLSELTRRAGQLALREHVSEGEVSQPAVSARHFEDALAAARQSAALSAMRQQSAAAAAQEQQAGAADSLGTDDAAGTGSGGNDLGAEDRTPDGSQSAWIRAAAARAADDVRRRMADDASAEVARLRAYIKQLEAALQAKAGAQAAD